MSTQVDTGAAAVSGSLKDASLDRLVCLQRHWMWTDEAMARFDRELAAGVDTTMIPCPIARLAPSITGARCYAPSGRLRSITVSCRHPNLKRFDRTSRPVCPASERADSFSLSSLRRSRSILVSWTWFAMAKRCHGCGASIRRSVKRYERSMCRGRSTHWICEGRAAPAGPNQASHETWVARPGRLVSVPFVVMRGFAAGLRRTLSHQCALPGLRQHDTRRSCHERRGGEDDHCDH